MKTKSAAKCGQPQINTHTCSRKCYESHEYKTKKMSRKITINMAQMIKNHNTDLNESPQNLQVLILHKPSEIKLKSKTCVWLPVFLTATRSVSETSIHIFYRIMEQRNCVQQKTKGTACAHWKYMQFTLTGYTSPTEHLPSC